MSMLGSSTTNYSQQSPFRSWHFDIVTAVLILFVDSGARAVQLQPQDLMPSQTILGLMLVPVAVWVLALMMHSEMRAIVGELEDMRSVRVRLHQERLARLHYGLILGFTIRILRDHSRAHRNDSLRYEHSPDHCWQSTVEGDAHASPLFSFIAGAGGL